jgi:hypothetical protein
MDRQMSENTISTRALLALNVPPLHSSSPPPSSSITSSAPLELA